jgi:hypothetical protein
MVVLAAPRSKDRIDHSDIESSHTACSIGEGKRARALVIEAETWDIYIISYVYIQELQTFRPASPIHMDGQEI